MNKFEQHVANKCANYDKNGKCLLDTTEEGCRDCPLFSGGLARCLYYETAVLPERPSLEREYWEARGVTFDNLSTCALCSQLFSKKSNAQKYCESCADFRKKQVRSKQNARYYEKQKTRV